MKLKKIKREFIEWGVILGVGLGLYFTGLHTEVIGMMQRVVLAPGLMKPEIIPEEQQQEADFGFELIDDEGRRLSFEEFKGKTVFLNLWATWCPPCIAEMPDINSLYKKTDHDKVAFVMISRDQDFNTAIKFSRKKSYDFPIYSQVTNLPQVYQTQSIPTTYVISPEGKIVAQRKGMAKYDTEEFIQFLSEL